MALLAVSDVVWQAIIAAAVTVILAWMNQRTKNAVTETAKEAAVKTAEVKTDLAISHDIQNDKLNTIHGLVNSALGDVKKNLAVTARSKAEITNSPIDIAAAEKAEQDSTRHDQTQTEQNTGGKNG